MVFIDNEGLHHLCCGGVWTDHAGVVVVVSFGSKREVNVGWVWEDMQKMLYHIGEFVCGSELCLTGTDAGTGLTEWFIDDIPFTTEDNKSNNWALIEHFQVCYLFCHDLHLWSQTGVWVACWFFLGNGCWFRDLNVGLLVMREGVENLSVGFCGW